MTKYRVTDPQGQTHEFEGPEGASPEQVLQVAQRQFGQTSHTDPMGAEPAQSPQDAAFAAGRQAGSDEGAATAGISQAAQQGTFGLQNYINAGARYVAQRLAGVKNADDYSTDLAYSRGKSQGEAEGHPIASTVGGTLGTFLGGAGAAKVLKAIPGGAAVSRFIAPQKGAAVANVAKAATTAGGIGGLQALAEGQSAPQAAQTAGLSAVAGTIAPKVLSFAASKLTPVAQKAMQTLADNIGETPDVLQQAYDSFIKLTGRTPSMAEIVGLKSQGKLRALASANAEIGDTAVKAADMGGAPLHEQLAAAQGATKPQTASGFHELRDAETDAAMNTPHPQTGTLLKDEPVTDPQGILADPHVQLAMQPNASINARLNQPSPVMDRITNNQATIGDVDTVRKALRDMQNQFSRPAPGSSHMKDPAIAKEFGDLANKVETLGSTQHQDYGLVLNNYRQHSRYADGFTHGLNGRAIADVPEGDSQLSAALKTPAGIAGYEHGNALARAETALNAIAPGTVKPQGDSVTPSHVAQGAMAASSGGISAVYHAMRAIPGFHLPEATQKVIANQLFNPKTTQQGINNLRRAGVDADNIRQIAGMVGAAAGANVGSYLSNNGQ